MKIKEEFLMRKVADSWIVVPIDKEAEKFNGMISLNESGAFLWSVLKEGASRERLVDALCAEYDVDRDLAGTDVDAFIDRLNEIHCMDDSDC